jgi:hypothetical protein
MKLSLNQPIALVVVTLAGLVSSPADVTINAVDLGYGISGKQNNNFFSQASLGKT